MRKRRTGRGGSTGTLTIWGVNPVNEFVLNATDALQGVVLLPSFGKNKRQKRLLRALEHANIPVATYENFSGMGVPPGAVHQGVAARVRAAWDCRIEDLPLVWGQDTPLLVCCDEITDPRNLGAIIRASAAFGAHAMVLSARNSAEINGTVVKASAGAIVHLKICQVKNMSRALDLLKEMGIWAGALEARGTQPIWDHDLTVPLALVLGAEGSGIRPLVSSHCDFSLRIPQSANVDSMNVASACSVALYEAVRQRETP